MRVYVDTYAGDGTAVLVGYKGARNRCTYLSCPLATFLLMSSGVVMDPNISNPL